MRQLPDARQVHTDESRTIAGIALPDGAPGFNGYCIFVKYVGREKSLILEQLRDEFAQPLVRSIVMVAFMPVLADVDAREFDRRFQHPDVRLPLQCGSHACRNRGDRIGLRDDGRQGHEMRHSDGDLSLQALLQEDLLDGRIVPGPGRCHDGMGGRDVRLQARRRLDQRMVAPHDAYEPVAIQALLVKAGPQTGENANGKVDFTGFHGGLRAGLRHPADPDAKTRRQALQAQQDPGQEHHFADLGEIKGECLARAGGRIEAGIDLQCRFQQFTSTRDRFRQLLRIRRWLHARYGAHEERVVKQLPQARQRIAHCGLAQANAVRRQRHIAFPYQRVEGHQQIDVDRA